MKKAITFVVAGILIIGFAVYGCTQKKAASSKEAIEASKAMQTVQEKVDYLIGQAKAFYNSKDFQGAMDTAQYVLGYLDKNSQEAKNLLEKTKSELKAAASKTLGDMQQKVDNW
jgi:hypothetical protein